MMIILQLIAMLTGGCLFGGITLMADSAEWFVVLLTTVGAFVGWAIVWLALVMGWVR